MKNKKLKISIIVCTVICVLFSSFAVLGASQINLQVLPNASENKIRLEWSATNFDDYAYKAYKKEENGEYQPISAVDFTNELEVVRVLNVYPIAAGSIPTVTFRYNDGTTANLPKSASLKAWMEGGTMTQDGVVTTFSPAGINPHNSNQLIRVTEVPSTSFNSNPAMIWNYDVVMFGTWDTNGDSDDQPNDTAVAELRRYLDAGLGVVAGHDTIGYAYEHGLNKIRSYFGIDAGVWSGPIASTSKDYNISWGYSSTTATVVKNDVITSFPWNLPVGTKLTIPSTHTCANASKGIVSMQLTDGTVYNGDPAVNYPGTGNPYYYISRNNNAVMIQTGHSNCNSTEDERKVLANALFYLKQLTNLNYAIDNTATDKAAPSLVNVVSKSNSGRELSLNLSREDNGTTYTYYVEGISRYGTGNITSDVKSGTITTEVKGYSYVIDENPTTEVDNTIDTTSSNIKYTLGNGPKTYIHIKAIDNAGNIGPTNHILVHTNVAPELALSQNPTNWTNQNVTITAVGTDSDGTVVSITKPDGQVATGSTTTYVVEENGEYTFTATDNSGATTSKTIEITNIDKFAPWGSATITQPTKDVRAAVINMSAMDDLSGVAKIIKPDGTEVTSTSTTYNVTKPGTYTFKIIDRAGNEGRLNVAVVIRSDGVVVKYVDVGDGNREIAGKTYLTGNVEEDYTTTPKTINNYELVNVPTNANGKFTIDEQTVVYGYKLISYVTVRCVDENTNRILYLSEPVKYLQGDTYRTTRREIDGYTYTRVDKAEEAQIGREDITVTYYYKKNTSVTVKYVDMLDNNKEIHASLPIPGLQGDNYTTKPIEIEGYRYIQSQGVVEGKMGSEPSTVVYKYKKLANLVTEHIDANTGEKITEDVTTTYKEGDTYEALAQNVAGYVVVEEPEEKTGIMGRDEIRRQYYYKKISKGLVVKYVDVKTNEVLDREIYEGNENDKVTLETKQFLHYVLHSKPDMDEILLTPEAKELVYYYRRTVEMDVVGIDVDTGEELYQTQISGREDDDYSTIAKLLDGYEIIGKSSVTGNFDRADTRIEFIYKKIDNRKDSSVILKYVDKDTNKVLKSETITAKVGDKYSTEKLEFSHYDFVEIVGNANGTITEETQEVTYYYTKKTGKVIITYEDESGNEIQKEEITGKYGTDYKVEIDDIKGYEIIERPTNTQGKFTEDIIEIKVKVKKITEQEKYGKVIVIYEDENGNEIKKEEATGKVGQNYKVNIEHIEGYELVKRPENLEGKYVDGIVEVKVKLQKIKPLPENKSTIVVRFVDENGDIIKEDLVKTGKPGEDFYIELPEIDGYKIIGDKTIKTKFVDGELVIDAKYEKIEEPKEDNIPDTGDINLVVICTLFAVSMIVIYKKILAK